MSPTRWTPPIKVRRDRRQPSRCRRGLARTGRLVGAAAKLIAPVPALMRLAGRAYWWAPAPLRRLHAWLESNEAAPYHGGPATAPAGACR